MALQRGKPSTPRIMNSWQRSNSGDGGVDGGGGGGGGTMAQPLISYETDYLLIIHYTNMLFSMVYLPSHLVCACACV